MRKAIIATLASLTLLGGLLTATPAGAAACTTTTYNSPANCDVTVSVTVPLAATLTFTSVNGNLGTVLPGVTYDQPTGTGVVGTYGSNGGTSTLAVTCAVAVAPAFSMGASTFRVKFDQGTEADIAAGSLSTCTGSLGNASGKVRTTTGASQAFNDSYGASIAAGEPAASHTVTLRYAISVA